MQMDKTSLTHSICTNRLNENFYFQAGRFLEGTEDLYGLPVDLETLWEDLVRREDCSWADRELAERRRPSL